MTQPAIKVEGLWKEYTVGAAQDRHTTFYDVLSQTLMAPFQRLRALGGASSETEQFWALRDVNFEVQPGEVLGVIGRNGAGKSTLLKILSRITAPSRGKVSLRGRVASLLEVGTGFHPELSGRENIYLNATILGMGQREIARKFDQIVAFSGVEKFLDTAVKRYSTGMYVRLAFAVAAHVEADILLVDEVLAVGDAEFQKRCLGLMGEVARGGRTVLFVSHNLTALRNLCSEGLLLRNGSVETFGPVADALNQYAFTGTERCAAAVEIDEAHADKVAALRRVAVEAADAESGARIAVDTAFNVRVRVDVRRPETDIAVFLSCFDSQQNRVFSSASFFDPALNGSRLGTGLHEFSCRVPAFLLNTGGYTLDVILIRDRSEVVLTEAGVVSFQVASEANGIAGWNWPVLGIVRPKLDWAELQVSDADE